MDISPWMKWFLGCLTRAIEGAQTTLSGVIAKGRYWEKLRDGQIEVSSDAGTCVRVCKKSHRVSPAPSQLASR
jgi:hypothetical protein